MLKKILTTGAVAGTALTAAVPAVPAGAGTRNGPEQEATRSEPGSTTEEQHCIVDAIRTSSGENVVDNSTMRCWDTEEERDQATGRARVDLFVLARHYEHFDGGGSSVAIQASQCAATWYPTNWWRYNMSSTKVSVACSAAKHYTGTNCSGSYQITEAGSIENLNSSLNNNVGCVKYA